MCNPVERAVQQVAGLSDVPRSTVYRHVTRPAGDAAVVTA